MGKEYIINYKAEREREIVKTSIMGIVANTILSVFKILVGILANSTVIILDGVSSISNAMGSVVTIIGIKFSGKAPDRKHPLGYGRVEFITDLLVAALVIYIGFTALIASISNIFQPEKSTYHYATFIVLIVSVIVKLFLAKHEKETGFRLKSRSLIGAAVDSFANALVSISIIISAIIYIKFGFNLESYIGVMIAGLIIRGGIIMLKDTIEEVLGKKATTELVEQIKASILELDSVLGVYDVILHSYGRDRYVGSLHIEIPCSITTLELDLLQRRISKKVYQEHGVALAGISIYAVNVEDEEVYQMHQFIKKQVMAMSGISEVHGILIDQQEKKVYFDIIIKIDIEDKKALLEQVKAMVSQKYPAYRIYVQNDIDI